MKALEENDCDFCDHTYSTDCNACEYSMELHRDTPSKSCPYRLITAQAQEIKRLEGERDELVDYLDEYCNSGVIVFEKDCIDLLARIEGEKE